MSIKGALVIIPSKINAMLKDYAEDLEQAWTNAGEEPLTISFSIKIGPGWGLSTEDAAYIAGVVDGEGTIRINKVRSKNMSSGKYYWRYSPSLTINQKGNKLLSHIASLCPEATLWKPKETSDKINQWRIQWLGHRAIRMVKAIAPYLKLKKEQAYLMLEFQERIDRRKNLPNMRKKLGSSELEWRTAKIIEMAALKKQVDSNRFIPEHQERYEKVKDSMTFEWIANQEKEEINDRRNHQGISEMSIN